MPNRTTVQSVASDLKSHEAKCEERWKTIFKETAEIKQEMNDLNKTLRIAMFGTLGFIGTLLIAFVTTVLGN